MTSFCFFIEEVETLSWGCRWLVCQCPRRKELAIFSKSMPPPNMAELWSLPPLENSTVSLRLIYSWVEFIYKNSSSFINIFMNYSVIIQDWRNHFGFCSILILMFVRIIYLFLLFFIWNRAWILEIESLKLDHLRLVLINIMVCHSIHRTIPRQKY